MENYLDNKRILAVDDEPDILDTIEEELPMCDVIKANSFEDAKELLTNEYFDLALLDIMGVDGYKLLDLAKQKNVTAVMLTAHALTPEDLAKSHKKGAASYLPKEEIENIATYLEDVFRAQINSEDTWKRWYDKLSAFFDKRFGPDWKDRDKYLRDYFNYTDVG